MQRLAAFWKLLLPAARLNGLAAAWRALGNSRPASPIGSPLRQDVNPIAADQRLSATDQWSRLNLILKASISRAEEVMGRQKAATQQLDLAQYALATLADELSAVMAIPGRRERAPVFRFEPNARATRDQSLAA